MRKISVAQLENSRQSSGGAPSSWQMMWIGYGSQTSATSSQFPTPTTGSTRALTTSRMAGRSRLAAAGVNAGATSRRRRACGGPSMARIDSPRSAR